MTGQTSANVDFTKADLQRISSAILGRLPGENKQLGTCPICQTRTWQLQNGIFYHGIYPPHSQLPFDTPPFITASVALMCITCGNTQFLNLRQLGLADLLERTE